MNQDAISLLKQDHENVKRMLGQLMESGDGAIKTRSQLLEKIASELRIHTQIEEEVFYPAFRDAGKHDEKKMYFEAVEEHRAVEELVLPDLEHTDPSSDEFAGRVKVLKEMVEHHANEEESDIFPKAKQMFDEEQLASLGQKMAELKQQLSH